MKKIIIFTVITTCCLELSASVKCYIKIGFGDCLNCYNLLSIVNDFEKEYVFKEEFKGFEKEILREYLGLEGELVIHTSDSFYNSFGSDDFTVLSFYLDSQYLFKCPMSELDNWSATIAKLKNNIHRDEIEVNLDGIWHNQCQIKLTKLEEIVVLDPLLNKLYVLDKNGVQLQNFSVTKKFVENVYFAKFGENNAVLNDFYKISKVVGNKSAAISLINITVCNNIKYVLLAGRYFSINKLDTILTQFVSVVEFNENFDYKIINVTPELGSGYYLGQSYFQAIDDSTVLFDVISVNPGNPNYIIAENRKKNDQLKFIRFYNDTIPKNLVDKKFNYRVTSFTQDRGYVAYSLFNKIYKNSIPLVNFELFENYKFGIEFPNPKNFITGILKNGDLLFVSYQIDTLNYVTCYDLNIGKTQLPIFSIPNNRLNTFLQLDCPGLFYYINKEKKLVKYKL